MTTYDTAFFERIRASASESAAVVVPIVLELMRPRSVVDVGCGTGAWLAAFRGHGVADVLGIDGSPGAGEALEIAPDQFRVVDLRLPVTFERRFDLAICLEVGEHLPAEHAHTLIASLVGLAPVVLFSAAIPGQGGTGHVNEQWPPYWAALFAAHEYEVIDPIRRRVWDNPGVAYWYAQNSLVFASREALDRWPSLAAEWRRTTRSQLSLVHPQHYVVLIEWAKAGVEGFTGSPDRSGRGICDAEGRP